VASDVKWIGVFQDDLRESLTRGFVKALVKRAMKVRRLFFKLTPLVVGLVMIASFAGCWKKSGEATVLEKEHIDAGEDPPTPTPGPASDAAAETAKPSASPAQSPGYVERELAPDEIVVDSYVMKKNLRGTSKDPRAYPGHEQWRITVQMNEGGRWFIVRAKKAQFERLKVGDRVKVRYSEGKYTGTVWGSEIVD